MISKEKTLHGLLGGLEQVPTGINGLDEITYGGLPRRRPTLVCRSARCCKALKAMEFLARVISRHGEPGLFMALGEPMSN